MDTVYILDSNNPTVFSVEIFQLLQYMYMRQRGY